MNSKSHVLDHIFDTFFLPPQTETVLSVFFLTFSYLCTSTSSCCVFEIPKQKSPTPNRAPLIILEGSTVFKWWWIFLISNQIIWLCVINMLLLWRIYSLSSLLHQKNTRVHVRIPLGIPNCISSKFHLCTRIHTHFAMACGRCCSGTWTR